MARSKYVRVGWFYSVGGSVRRRGLFCPVCGKGLWKKVSKRPRIICLNCGWEEQGWSRDAWASLLRYWRNRGFQVHPDLTRV